LSPSVVSRPIDDEYEGFPGHVEFQHLTLQLLQSLLPHDETDDLTPLLIEALSTIMRLDPLVVSEGNALDMAFHFFASAPQVPAVASLAYTLNFWVLRKIWCVGGLRSEGMLSWLGKAVELMQVASSRGKDDALIPVTIPAFCS